MRQWHRVLPFSRNKNAAANAAALRKNLSRFLTFKRKAEVVAAIHATSYAVAVPEPDPGPDQLVTVVSLPCFSLKFFHRACETCSIQKATSKIKRSSRRSIF